MQTKIFLPNLISLSELNLSVVFPPGENISEVDFYKKLQEEVETFLLPVSYELVSVKKNDDAPYQDQLCISLQSGKYNYLKVLVGLQKVGCLGYVERKSILMPPALPPRLNNRSDGLPPRLNVDSPELPSKQEKKNSIFSPKHTPNGFNNEVHEQRVKMMEKRRLERMDVILKRQRERDQCLEDWFSEVVEIVKGYQGNPAVLYLKDSIDVVIRSVISHYEEKGVKSRDTNEIFQRQEDLMTATEMMRQKFM